MGIKDIFKKRRSIDDASQKLIKIKELLTKHMEKCKQQQNNTKLRIEYDFCQSLLKKLEE